MSQPSRPNGWARHTPAEEMENWEQLQVTGGLVRGAIRHERWSAVKVCVEAC